MDRKIKVYLYHSKIIGRTQYSYVKKRITTPIINDTTIYVIAENYNSGNLIALQELTGEVFELEHEANVRVTTVMD
ncbi:hypothetical protein [Desnuesiella massiliensis]|uniref:hypothetical protein n=1 Tax=Desnuesiella massiliensis TaxID=1650662 RepID=UPI0006E44768|nr:hypothetical protein [Desnuesiella massiliensis]